MGNTNKRWCACWYSAASSSSTTFLLLMVPLIVISGFVSLLGPNTTTSDWSSMSIYRFPWLWSSAGFSSSSNFRGKDSVYNNTVIVFPPSNDGVLDLRSTVVVQVDANVEEAISDEYSVLNRSSSSQFPKEAFSEIQILVSYTTVSLNSHACL